MDNLLMHLPNLKGEEAIYLKELTRNMTDNEMSHFVAMYRGKRKDPQTYLLLSALGFLGVAGVQRFVTEDIVWGIIYFLTGGFCMIGTVVDMVNAQKNSWKYNREAAMESANTVLLLNS